MAGRAVTQRTAVERERGDASGFVSSFVPMSDGVGGVGDGGAEGRAHGRECQGEYRCAHGERIGSSGTGTATRVVTMSEKSDETLSGQVTSTDTPAGPPTR